MRWTVHLSGGPRRVNHAAACIGHKIYSFGGYCSSEEYQDWAPIQVHVLDTNTLRWSEIHYENLHEAPFQRYGHTVVAYQGKVYLWGGRNNTVACNTLYVFDCQTLLWSRPEATGMIPYAVDGHSACVIENKMFVFGGFEYYNEQYSQELYVLNLDTLVWQFVVTKGNPPSHRDFHSAVAIGKRMYIVGGRGDLNGPYNSQEELYCPEVYYYDTETNEWFCPKAQGDWPEGRRSQSAWYYDGYLYMFGGYNDNVKVHYNDLYRFCPKTNRWNLLIVFGPEPTRRRRQCCIPYKDKVYLFGGTSPHLLVCPKTQYYYEDPEKLIDNDDLYILDYSPSLMTLSILAVVKIYGLDITGLPKSIITEIESMITPNTISKSLPEQTVLSIGQLL